jgi:hypothetical protein
MQQARKIGREIGTAFAVLAIYLLTILAPLHQARATQLDMAELGYVTAEAGWVLCSGDQGTGDKDTVIVSKCPAAGIGKQDLIGPTLAAVILASAGGALANVLPALATAAHPARNHAIHGARAPPVAV